MVPGRLIVKSEIKRPPSKPTWPGQGPEGPAWEPVSLHLEMKGVKRGRSGCQEEVDGPRLRHGLLGFQGKNILLHRHQLERPSQEYLEERYELFRKAG